MRSTRAPPHRGNGRAPIGATEGEEHRDPDRRADGDDEEDLCGETRDEDDAAEHEGGKDHDARLPPPPADERRQDDERRRELGERPEVE